MIRNEKGQFVSENKNEVTEEKKNVEVIDYDAEIKAAEAKLEELNAQYDKYGRIYQMFINKHQGIEQYMISTQVSFNLISSTGAKALNLILQLYTPAD